MAKPESGFMMSIVRILSSSTAPDEREREKSRIEKSFSECDKKLSDLVTDNYEDLGKILQAFSTIYKRISESREKIKKIKEDLNSCKTLLHCKRDELRRLWVEGLEHKTIVTMMDQIEEIKDVSDKMDRYMASKHYLHAADLIVNAVHKLEGPLYSISALRELRTELHAKKEQLYTALIDELHRQVYFKSTAPVAADYLKYGLNTVKDDSTTTAMSPEKYFNSQRLPLQRATSTILPSQNTPSAGEQRQVSEDLNVKDPEANIVHFVTIIVESLNVLRKIPETVNAIKLRMQPELLSLVARSAQTIADCVSSQQVESLSQLQQPRYLLELFELSTRQITYVLYLHEVCLENFIRATKQGGIIQLYTKLDIWSEVQAVIQLLLGDYLDVRNITVSRPQTAGNFDEPTSDIAGFFSKRRPNKPKKVSLFRFNASSHAISMNSYLREQRHFEQGYRLDGSQPITELNKPQFVCKPHAWNITAIYKPLQDYIHQMETDIKCAPGTSSLQLFLTDFVKNVFIGQVHFHVSSSITAVTKGFDSLRNTVDQKTKKELNLSCPILESTVVVYKNLEVLTNLMRDLPDYADQFLNMICHFLQQYRDHCHTAYRGIVQNDTGEKRIISALWAKDDDINRFLRSLPGWMSIVPSTECKLNEVICSDEEVRSVNSKESVILINNLSDSSISSQEIINDMGQLKTVANLHQSLEWLAVNLRTFIKKLSSPLQTSKVDSAFSNLPAVSQKTIDTLTNLTQDFQNLSEICLLLLHLEVRVHCFYFLRPAAEQSVYTGAIDDHDPDSNIVKLNTDLANIEDVLQNSLQPTKFKYIFDSLGYLVSSIFIHCAQFIKTINENGIKKVCRNIFTVQQNLTNITQLRESDLDHARTYYQLIYSKPDDIIQSIAEKGASFTLAEYTVLFQLIHRSNMGSDSSQLNARLERLADVMDRNFDDTDEI